MIWRLLLAAMAATVLTVTMGLFLVSCGSTGGSARGKVGGVEFEIVVNAQGKKEVHLKGSLPPGLRLEVSFIGADGKVIDTAITGVPGYLPVPDGTKGHLINLIECEVLTGAPIGVGHHVAAIPWHELSYTPIDPDFDEFNPFANSMASVRMKLPAGIDPVDALLALIEGGPGTPVGSGVEVDHFSRMVPGVGGARLQVCDTEPIVDFDLAWNGVQEYATLRSGNVTQFSAGNGWSVVQTMIPLSDFALGGTTWNGGKVTATSMSSTQPVSAEFAIEAHTP